MSSANCASAFACPAGLSDHSGVVFPALLALAKGADIVEAHITLDRRMFGPDVSSSLTVEEFALVREARDAFQTMEAHPVDKDAMAHAARRHASAFSEIRRRGPSPRRRARS